MPKQQEILVGMGGWDLVPFSGVFYPSSVKKGFRKLEFYSRHFDLVEINATFYNASFSPNQVKQWLLDVSNNPRFIFTVKLFKAFTHTMDATKGDADNVRRILGTLAGDGRLGGLVVQFPTSFTNIHERRLYLVRLRKAFEPHRVFVELRHRSWHSPLIVRMFQENDILPINVDLPQINRHMPFTAYSRNDAAYFRMMGRNEDSWNHPWRVEGSGSRMASDRYLYLYSVQELGVLVRILRALQPAPETTYVVFHNDPNAHSLVNGFQLRKLLNPKQRLTIPEQLLKTFPDLESVGNIGEPEYSLFNNP